MQGHQAQEVAIPVGDGTDSLAQAKRIDSRAVRRFEMLDSFPVEAGVAVKHTPFQVTQTAERGHHLLEIIRLEPEQRILKLGAVEVEANTVMSGCHGNASYALSGASIR